MKISCGTDIIEIPRIRQAIEDMGENFLQKVFTKKEIDYCESKKAQKYQHYAARFAAKEAGFKAISCLLDDKFSISWKDIEVENTSQGRPSLNITKIEGLEKIECIDVSLSHCKEYAVANVSLIYN